MKKILYLLVCMLLVGSIANAQKKDSTRYEKDRARLKSDSAAKAKLRDEGITKDLNLSRQQKKSMDSIHVATHKQKEAIENDKSLSDEQKKEKLKDLNKQQKSQMNNVMTPEQQEKAKQTRENKKKKEASSGSAGSGK